jgi:hypothetical protein
LKKLIPLMRDEVSIVSLQAVKLAPLAESTGQYLDGFCAQHCHVHWRKAKHSLS